jgi:hypothetical protein
VLSLPAAGRGEDIAGPSTELVSIDPLKAGVLEVSFSNLVEAAGIEPASASPLQAVLHA